MRLIDAEEMEKNGWAAQRIVQVDPHTMEWQKKKPTDFPAIDAVPVKHGEWCYGSEIAREYRVDGVHIYYEKCFCSVCGYEENYKPYWNYCPNCGACMTTKTPIDKDELAY